MAQNWLRRARWSAVPVLAVAALVAGSMPAESHDNAGQVRSDVISGRARSVIVLIGDGMGDSEITVARNYYAGANGRLAMDSLPMTGAYTTYAVNKDNPSIPDYVTDSAASGTGWATGHKTYNGAISVTPEGTPHATMLELAQQRGYKTGNVTTAELTDATPAVQDSHVTARGCQGPADMAACPTNDKVNGGAGSIAEQTIATNVDVLLGGGKARFDQTVKAGPYAGQTVIQQAAASGYTLATDKAGLDALKPEQKVLGLFHPSNMDLEWTGPIAAPFPANTAPVACTESNAAARGNQPHLSDMTRKSIDLLEAKSHLNKTTKGGKGFFLQVEGASIDKQDHAANPCGQIGETIEFDKSVAIALDYAKVHKDTLVIVTADHGHTSQIVEYPQTATHHATGAIATLRTHEGGNLALSYATNIVGQSQDHTGTEVRIAALGPQAYQVLGVTNQTDVFATVSDALGLV